MTDHHPIRDRRLKRIALTTRLGYIDHQVSEAQLTSWIERLGTVLRAGTSLLPGIREEHDPILDDVDLYRELEHQGFHQLVELQKEIGKRETLAALVLLQVKLGNREAAFEAWSQLRYLRETQSARRADLTGYRRRGHMEKANDTRLVPHRDLAREVWSQAESLRGAKREPREIPGIISDRTGLSRSQVRRILKKQPKAGGNLAKQK